MDAFRRLEWTNGQIVLEAAAERIRLVNEEQDESKMNWVKLSMLCCGLDEGR
ncbi:hypothetical protein PHPALM_18156 [Phytophthora palmivora]|uniref:Uncharacterized protein n=1 Tax=Phytophthora palmivora TaxID=4796 RepID=A0A2P4XKF6_9STRA|nr:hypothetical protein PHPALM_18156 [Phytophthora palmivora]